MEELLRYFMKDTNDRLDKIEAKIDDLSTFKIQMLATARMTSLVVSAICGFITLLVTTWLSIKYK